MTYEKGQDNRLVKRRWIDSMASISYCIMDDVYSVCTNKEVDFTTF